MNACMRESSVVRVHYCHDGGRDEVEGPTDARDPLSFIFEKSLEGMSREWNTVCKLAVVATTVLAVLDVEGWVAKWIKKYHISANVHIAGCSCTRWVLLQITHIL